MGECLNFAFAFSGEGHVGEQGKPPLYPLSVLEALKEALMGLNLVVQVRVVEEKLWIQLTSMKLDG